MAKFGAYFALCPLIDHRSLLGITPDHKKGDVVVTMGKNMGAKYKVSDQKQTHSWRTKERFSSPILWDVETSSYVAVFNELFIRFWKEDVEHLDKLKKAKVKFNQQIHTIFTCGAQNYIVFKNGAVMSLKKAIDSRNDLEEFSDVLDDVKSDYIHEVLYTSFNEHVYVCYVVMSGQKQYLKWANITASEDVTFHSIDLAKSGATLSGCLLKAYKTHVSFFSLWSDGRMFSVALRDHSSDLGELFSVIEPISCKEYVAMVSLDQDYIALYGCNSNDEGALLIIYNLQFKIVQTKQPFKLFSNGAKIWQFEQNHLLFPVGQNIAVIPFNLESEQLAALVGSHKIETDNDVIIVTKTQFMSWGAEDVAETKFKTPKTFKDRINDYLEQGWAECEIFETLSKELISNEQVKGLREFLGYFNDIPEGPLVQLLKYILAVDSNKQLLALIFTKSFNESLILAHLRTVLTIDEVIYLLQYIHSLLTTEDERVRCTELKLLQWTTALIDSSYQKCLSTGDERVLETINLLKSHLKEELEANMELRDLSALLRELSRGKSNHKRGFSTGRFYSIEEFPLYY